MIQGIEARDEEKYIRKYIAELKDKTDLIVLLIHQGISRYSVLRWNRRCCAEP